MTHNPYTPSILQTDRETDSLSSPRGNSQRPTPPRRENPHNAKNDIEQRQRIRDQTTHTAHAGDSTEHAGRAIRAPADGGRGEKIPEQGIHGEQDAQETGQDERQEAVAQDAGGAREGERRREVADGVPGVGLQVRVVVCRVCGVGGVGEGYGAGGVEGGRH